MAGCGLVLPGGGARGAYQVGVLKAVAALTPRDRGNPFPVIIGTSAGAINAAVLACYATHFQRGVANMEAVWANFRCQHIYRTGWRHNLTTGLHWMAAMALGGLGGHNPRSLLDNEPLAELLRRNLPLDGIRMAIHRGALRAVGVTGAGYTSGRAVTFFQAAPDVEGWLKGKRVGRPVRLGVQHLLASSALPFIFPARRVGHEYFGDGGLRQTTPLSPAIRLGADRLLIIGTRDAHPDPEPPADVPYPSMGDIGGALLDIIFMDHLQTDLERLERINRTLRQVAPEHRAAVGLKPIRWLEIQPSTDLREIGSRHMHRVPPSVRALFRGVGAWGPGRLPSYLLFEAEYCRELIDLGYQDAMAVRGELLALIQDSPEAA
ncbi:patatin-like phospholipase family protein [Alkalilimnicola ehrlichii MLHE-1]|uniref:Patatin n=1 Tax=Alkalilimnicola ehrlichii (strain ATCC BAA-1101 / DSM 17681 / MLHE-1) TaxID=187272 RepID=Q0A7T0_ALKEH|nr:patatin-like phospholipase family protein [Alkalilimnicola ehrlichii]ABI57107.1 Patatin [Alkalilimnicola ehrlichii MLHE-1]